MKKSFWISCFHLQRPLKKDNILFVGDAGVGAFPMTGQGIYRALLSGDVAGSCLAQKKPNKYPYRITQMFVKWDVVGRTYLYCNYALRRIGPGAVYASLNSFIRLHGSIH